MQKFQFNRYFDEIIQNLQLNKDLYKKLISTSKVFKNCKDKNKKLIFMGNGGSSATASHVSVDMTKNAKIRSINFNESDLITCLSNDYGFEKYLAQAIKMYADKGDIVIFMSCSGESKNLIEAIKICKKMKLSIVTFTGMSKNNRLKKQNSKGINFWVDSKSYNVIETIHHALLLSIVDNIIGKSIYLPN